MNIPDTTHGAGRAARRLHDDDIDFERRFDDLCARAQMGDWHELDEVWGAFAADVEAHLAFEEDVLFPAFAKQSTDCRKLVNRLDVEHAVIRELLEEIGLSIQLHVIRVWTIEVFVELMREHAEVENERLYPWVELEARSWSSATTDLPRRATASGSGG